MEFEDLKRHPLSAEYADLPDSIMRLMVADMHKNGFDDCRPVVLHEGMILDGWQRYTAALEADVRPAFVQLAEDVDPELFVRRHNDHRRHETKKQMDERAKNRRKSVEKKLEEGKSIRTIAKEEGVSTGTIQRDIEKIKPERTIVARNEDSEDSARTIVAPDEIVDSTGCPVPANLRAVFADVPLFDSAIAMLQKAAASLDRLEKSKAWTGDTRYSTYLRTAEAALKDLKPHSVGGPRGWKTAEEVEE